MNDKDRALEAFGKLLMERVRDEAISDWDKIVNGEMRSPVSQRLYGAMSSTWTPEQLVLLRRIIPRIVNTTLHHLLWTLEQVEWVDVAVTIDGETVPSLREVSDGLAGDMYNWIPEFSKERYEPDFE